MKKLLLMILPLMLLFMVASCGDKTDLKLSYSNNKIDVYVGETVSVKPTVSDSNVTLEYTLSSDIASVDASGTLTAISAGEVVVTVTAKGYEGKEAKLIVTIKDKEESYTIVLDVNGGDALSNANITFTNAASVTLPTPTKSGYKFLGWYEGETLVSTVRIAITSNFITESWMPWRI